MATYTVEVSRIETATIAVEAANESDATDEALTEASDNWEADTVSWQVDEVREVASV